MASGMARIHGAGTSRNFTVNDSEIGGRRSANDDDFALLTAWVGGGTFAKAMLAPLIRDMISPIQHDLP